MSPPAPSLARTPSARRRLPPGLKQATPGPGRRTQGAARTQQAFRQALTPGGEGAGPIAG